MLHDSSVATLWEYLPFMPATFGANPVARHTTSSRQPTITRVFILKGNRNKVAQKNPEHSSHDYSRNVNVEAV